MTKYEAVHPTAVSKNKILIRDANNLYNKPNNLFFILKFQITNVIPNEYILEYSAAVAPMYITKY